MMDMNVPLPDGWAWFTLGEVADLVGGGTPSRGKPEYFKGNIVWLTPTEIPRNRVTVVSDSNERITEEALKKSSARLVPNGTVLMTSRASIGYVAIAGTEVTTNQGFASFLCKENVYNYYLAYWLLGNADFFIQQATGTTFKEITKSKLRNISFPLPPLPEQERIVRRIEELFSQLEAGVAGLKRAQTALKRYKASMLKYACEGQQVGSGRAKDLTNLDEGLSRHIPIRSNRSLPESWLLKTVEDLYDVVGGGTPSTSIPEYWEGDIPWITSADIHDLKDVRPRKNITKDAISKSATNLVPSGSLIVVTRVSLGKVALPSFPLCFSQDSQALIPKDKSILPEYALYYLAQAVQIFKSQGRGTTILGVTKKQLKELPFPLPPLAEQRQIVAEIERRLSMAQQVEAIVAASLARAGRLRQAMLKCAFEGRL